MNEIIHVSAAPDGSILEIPFSSRRFMKVCNPHTGVGGVIELLYGTYLTYADLEKRWGSQYCKVLYKNLDELYSAEGL
jgi:hypothetical protein